MTPASWLFVRGPESIRIVRPRGFALIVKGPGHAQQRSDFRDEDELQQFQVSIAERLSEQGWILLGADVDRRAGGDRRAALRGTSDRRAEGLRAGDGDDRHGAGG
jgi:hypothetical protein